MPLSLPENILQSLEKLPETTRYIIAFSGGVDSVVLLHALVSMQDRLAAAISVVHVDHGIHSDSGGWAEWCRKQCVSQNLRFVVKQVAVKPEKGESIEAVARKARYSAITKEMQEGDIVLTAHHQNDQAETVLLNLLRGAGPAGLAAMPLYREFASGYLARPMLGVSRQEIVEYAKANKLSWLEDPSNMDDSFDRNYLRTKILPLIQQRWPGYAATLSRSALHCAAANDHLNEHAFQLLGKMHADDGALSLGSFAELSLTDRRLVMRAWLTTVGAPVPDHRRMEKLCIEMVEAGRDKQPMVEWADRIVRRYCDKLHLIGVEMLQNIPQGPYLWEHEGKLELPENGCLITEYQLGGIRKEFWQNGRVMIHYRQGGEQCKPAGKGITRPLKKLLHELRVPPWLRSRQPLVIIDGELACIPGLILCEPFAAKPLFQRQDIQSFLPG